MRHLRHRGGRLIEPGAAARAGGALALYAAAALAEIGGCFAMWSVVRGGRSLIWLGPGAALLGLFAWLLTFAPADAAGRAYAAYGGLYILASLLWLRVVEGVAPDRWDMAGAALAVAGAGVILVGRHAG